MTALAGCSTGNSGSDSGPADTGTPTSSSETGTAPEGDQIPTNEGAHGDQSSDSTDIEDIENEYETSFEESLSEYGNWFETSDSMLEIPTWAIDNAKKRWYQYDTTPLEYRDFVNVFMNSEETSTGTFIEHFVAFSDEIENGEYSSEDPYRLVSLQHRIEERDSQFMGYSDIPVKSSALERFLQQNVHGVIDNGEETDAEILEYARQ
jgi:hypothetical protein